MEILLASIIFLVLVFITDGIQDVKTLSVPNNECTKNISRKNHKQIKLLRDRGKGLLSVRSYEKASDYYAAVLQIVEGVGGPETVEIRRRCFLTLADCEIKLSRYNEAIARCTELIDESPSVLVEGSNEKINSNLQESLGKAFYRRGIALMHLNKSTLALLDFKSAKVHIPTDIKIEDKINSIKMSGSVDLALESHGHNAYLENDLRECVDDALLQYPRPYFTASKLSQLCKQAEVIQRGASNPMDFGGFDSLFRDLGGGDNEGSRHAGGLGMFGGLGGLSGSGSGIGGDERGGALGGLSGLGALGGLSGLGGLLGSGGKSDGTGWIDMISALAPLVGIDKSVMTNISEILKAGTQVFQKIQRVSTFVIKHMNAICTSLVTFWLIFFFSTLRS